jgi:hypothetical protein
MFKKLSVVFFLVICSIFVISPKAFGQKAHSIHAYQMQMLENTTTHLEPWIEESLQKDATERAAVLAQPLVVTHAQDTNFIVFGYQQADVGYDYHYVWPALTHIGASFIYFNTSGNITNLSAWTGRAGTLQGGGSAQANGVRVVMVLNSNGSSEQYAVLTSASKRQNLINQVVSAVTSDAYCQGVSLDFEPWISNSGVRTGLTAFCQSLYTTLKAISSNYELSYYANSSYSSSQLDASIINYLDYILYSCYDWSVDASNPIAVSDAQEYIPYVNGYINAGFPPNKIVLALSAYGHEWETNGATYTSAITDDLGDYGYLNGYYDVTLQPAYGGPYAQQYHRGDETGWYTYNDGTNQHLNVDDNPESLEYKLRMVKSWQDPDDVNNGKRLRGVAFWSLYWMATGTSYDPITQEIVSKTRTYPQVYQLCDEIFNPPGNRSYMIEKFEGPDSERDYRWRNPSESPDSMGYSVATTAITVEPGGPGAPPNSTNGMSVTWTFASTSGNQLFFRHEILNDNVDTTVTDRDHAKFYVTRNSKIHAYAYSEGNYTGMQVQMVVMDTTRQVFKSSPYSLATAGWQYLEWDLTDPTQISGYTTAEPAFITGGSTFNSSTTGDRDIGFIGFFMQGGTIGSGSVFFDEISYTPTNPAGQNYVINEFRYNNTSQQFVEIYGPAGALPSGMQLLCYEGTDGAITTAINLSGSINDSGNGYGYFVVGDSGVPNVNQVIGGSTTIPNIQPCGMQLYNAVNGNVYDSVVFQAFGGLNELIRKQTLGVTQNGYGWIGEVGPGSNSAGQTYSMGRYPDGSNTWINENDFSFMPATPGARNGGSISGTTTFNFDTPPTTIFQTYQPVTVLDPTSVGLPYSPDGGNAYRCSDPTGGGVIGVIGDAALGAGNTGYSVTGQIYIPLSTDTPQANAVGICGRQGSNFFTPTKSTLDYTGYESGYWLIYENASGVGLNDGLSDHPGTFNFEYAFNDNMSANKVSLLSSVSLASTGVSAGTWTTFILSINPGSNNLTVEINNVTIYNGPIPSGGPTSGAFQVGFRENYYPLPTTQEGTWIDGLMIQSTPVSISDWNLYSRK